MRHSLFFSISCVLSLFLFACGNHKSEEAQSIAIFVPGVLAGSPSYVMMDSGVRSAAGETGFHINTIEGGFDQASWSSQLMALASEKLYSLIVTSNPAMTEICVNISSYFPEQDFLVLDGSGLTGGSVTDVVYDHREQAFLIGYFAGLATISEELEGSNKDLKVGIIIGQEYPQMNQETLPGFEMGLQTVNPDITLESRVLGNWYDAEKARELAAELYASGVDVILTISGGANQGIISAAREADAYVLWFDADGSALAPGTVLASAVTKQDEVAKIWTSMWINGNLPPGESHRGGLNDGYIDFPLDSKLFRKHVPESIRTEMKNLIDRIKNGSLNLRILDE